MRRWSVLGFTNELRDCRHSSTKDTDLFVVNTQRTLVLHATGARYPVPYQTMAVRMSYAHVLEQPSPYDSAQLASALSYPDEHEYVDGNHHSSFKDSDNDRSHDDDTKLHLTAIGDY